MSDHPKLAGAFAATAGSIVGGLLGFLAVAAVTKSERTASFDLKGALVGAGAGVAIGAAVGGAVGSNMAYKAGSQSLLGQPATP